jgi:hypothetical protein
MFCPRCAPLFSTLEVKTGRAFGSSGKATSHVRDRKPVEIRDGRATVSGEPLFVTDLGREDAQHTVTIREVRILERTHNDLHLA